jgi:hypothetical protein
LTSPEVLVHDAVGVVGEFGLAVLDDGRVGIGGGHAAVVDLLIAALRFLGALGMLLEPPFELGVAVVQPMFQRADIHHRIHRGVGVDEAGVDEDLAAIDQARLDTLPDDADEEALKGPDAPAGSSFGEHAVVGDLGVDVVAQEPQPVQAERQRFHEFAFGAHVLEHEQEHEFEDDGRRDRGVSVVPVGAFYFIVNEVEVDDLQDTTKDMIFRYFIFNAKTIIKQFRLKCRSTFHHGKILCRIEP